MLIPLITVCFQECLDLFQIPQWPKFKACSSEYCIHTFCKRHFDWQPSG